VSAARWDTRPLGELFDIGSGKTMSAAARKGVDKIPFLRTSNVLWDRLDLDSLDEMAISEAELSQRSLRPGDLLVCEGGEIGRAAVWDGSIDRITFQNHVHRLRAKEHLVDEIDPRFYVFFLQSAFTQQGIFEGAGNRTTIPNLSRSHVAGLEVPFPSFPEQRAIVTALGLARRAADLQTTALSTAQALRRSALSELLSKGQASEPTRESEIGEVPASWDVVEFSTVREDLRYGTSVRCTLEPKAFPVLRIPNILSARIDSSELKYADLAPKEAARYKLESGDLIFIRTNGVIERLGLCAVYRDDPADALFASYLIRARLKPGVDPDFMAYYFSSDAGISQISARATPAADGKYNLNTGIIDSLVVPLPSLSEQQEIAAVIRAIDKKIAVHRSKLEAVGRLFERLLQGFMTGELVVEDLVPEEGMIA
jgi:type I restriction enzyme S subunit